MLYLCHFYQFSFFFCLVFILFFSKMSGSPFTNSLCRTTTAVTIFDAGIKENVIPPYAEAIVNHRIHPGQTSKEVGKNH